MQVLVFIIKFVCLVCLPLFFIVGFLCPLFIGWLHPRMDPELREMKKAARAARAKGEAMKAAQRAAGQPRKK